MKEAELKICLYGSVNRYEQLIADIEKIVLTWVEPMRAMTADKLATKVSVIDGQSGCHGSVVVNPGVWAQTTISKNPVVQISDAGYFASYNVVLHEFGHAFGLDDTYSGGQSGSCQPGQPQSVMCNTSFSGLRQDDINGLHGVFKRAYPSDKPGNSQDSDPTPNPSTPSTSLYAAIQTENNTGELNLLISAIAARGQDVAEISYCPASKQLCQNDQSLWVEATPTVANNIAVPLYRASGIFPAQQPHLTLRAKINSVYQYREIRFKSRN